MDGISPQHIEIDTLQESGKNIKFKKELLALFGTNTLEDARGVPFILEELPTYDKELLNEKENLIDKETIFRPQKEKRCQLCHQPISRIIEMRTKDSVSFIGTDCAAKVANFKKSGVIESVNLPQQKRNFKAFVEKALSEDGTGSLYEDFGDGPRRHGAKKHVFVASMLSWIKQYITNHRSAIDPNITRIYNDIELFEAPQTQEDSATIINFYTKTRTLIPQDTLTRTDYTELEKNPHKSLIEKTLQTPRNSNDIQRTFDVIYAYKEEREAKEQQAKLEASKEVTRKMAHLNALLRSDVIYSVADLEISSELLFKPAQKEERFSNRREALKSLFSECANVSFQENVEPKFAIRTESGVLHVYMYYAHPMYIIDGNTTEIPISKSQLLKDFYPHVQDVVLHTSYTVNVFSDGNVLIGDRATLISDDIDTFLSETH